MTTEDYVDVGEQASSTACLLIFTLGESYQAESLGKN